MKATYPCREASSRGVYEALLTSELDYSGAQDQYHEPVSYEDKRSAVLRLGKDHVTSDWQVIDEIPSFVPGFEGLRGLSVLLVQFTHIGFHWSQVYFAQAGVAIFFVLSGFLITGVLQQLQRRSERLHQPRLAHLKQFYLDRFVRLYPALFIMISATMCFRYFWFQGYFGPETKLDILAALTYLMDIRFAIVWGPSYYHVTWSLGVEEKFYIFWSLALPFIAGLRLRDKVVLLATLFSASLSLHILSYLINPILDNFLIGHFTPLPQFWKMLLGASLRLLPAPQVLRKPLSAWIGLALILVPWALSYYGPHFNIHRSALPLRTDLSAEILWEPIAAFAGALIIYGSIAGNTFLEMNSLRFLGRISYAWYLWQLPLLRITGGLRDEWPHGYQGFTTTCFALLCATISTLYIEEPIRMKYRQWKVSKSLNKLP